MTINKSGLFLILAQLNMMLSFGNPPDPDNVAPGTKKMSEIIRIIADTSAPTSIIYMNTQRAALIREKIKNADASKKIELRGLLGYELLQAGKTKEAIKEFEEYFRLADSMKMVPNHTFYSLFAIAYMRIGEQENCCSYHTAESCIVPIQGQGIHKLQKGSRRAIKIYEQILEAYPQDLQSKWLLNVAYMTLGLYPDSVPEKHFLPLKDSDTYPDFPHWTDIAPDCKLDKVGLAGGSIMEDFDRDGYLDIMSSSWGILDQIRYYHNNGDGTFTDLTREAGLTGVYSGLNILHADYNNDGWEDVFILRGAWLNDGGRHPNSLLRNNGNGTFEDVTIAAGLLSFHPTQTASWADFNNDGFLDLFIGNETDPKYTHPCEFYLNNGNGTFTDIAKQMKMDVVGYVKGVAWGDINNDGLSDLYISILGMKNKLFLNKGGTNASDWKFEDISAIAGVEMPLWSFPCWFFDYNNDGWQDIFVSGYSNRRDNVGFDAANEYMGNAPVAETPKIYLNNKNNTFTDVTNTVGFEKRVCYTMGSNFGDLDNDGWLDFYLGTGTPDYRAIVPNRMFHNDQGKFFSEVTFSGGFGHIQKGHGVSWGDVDNDGDQDIYMVIGGAVEGDGFTCALFQNPGNKNNWITLILEGSTCNKSAIGARVKVSVTATDGKVKDYYSICNTGGSFGSSSLQQEIGLGSASKINSVEIIFPDGKNLPVTYSGLELNKVYRIKQGVEKPEEVSRKAFVFTNR